MKTLLCVTIICALFFVVGVSPVQSQPQTFEGYTVISGLLISKSLQNSVKENPLFIARVKDFLSAGLSDSPRTIFRNLGIDIADKGFWEKGLNEVANLLQETTLLARRLGKLK